MVTTEKKRAYNRTYMKERRLDEAFREKERAYFKKWYSENGRERSDNYIECVLKWRQEHSDRDKVSQRLRYAVKIGKIVKPAFCEICGRETRLSGHHDDYSEPFVVLWLCSSCHKIKHFLQGA